MRSIFLLYIFLMTLFIPRTAYSIPNGTGAHEFPLGSDAGDDFIVDTNKLVVEGDSGEVGVGTTDPTGKLEVEVGATDGVSGILIDADDADQDGLEIDGGSLTTGNAIQVTVDGTLSDNTTVLNIDGDTTDLDGPVRLVELDTPATDTVDISAVYLDRNGDSDAQIFYDESTETWQVDHGDGGGLVDIEVEAKAYGFIYRNSSFDITAANTFFNIPLDQEVVKVNITHSNVTNPERVTVDLAGTYRIIYKAIMLSSSGSNTGKLRLVKNGTTEIPGSTCEAAPAGATFTQACSAQVLVSLAASDYVVLQMGTNTASLDLGVVDTALLPDFTEDAAATVLIERID